MALPEHWEAYFSEEKLFGVKMFCPHRKQPSTFTIIFYQSDKTFSNNSYYGIIQCNYVRCRQFVFFVTTNRYYKVTQDPEHDTLIYYPTEAIPKPHESFPNPIGEDWVEAQKAFRAGANKAAAVMCRRVLYGVLLEKKCKEHPLHESIAELIGKVRMPSIVEGWLAEIKEDGHDAAHPFRALDVPAENVLETMGYTKELLRFVYVEPFDLQKRLARKAAPATGTAAAATAPAAKTGI
jgi:hypothetical protein